MCCARRKMVRSTKVSESRRRAGSIDVPSLATPRRQSTAHCGYVVKLIQIRAPARPEKKEQAPAPVSVRAYVVGPTSI